MAYAFDGVNKIITYSAGTTAMDVKDLYSRWKDWVKSQGSQYAQAMSVVGGDPIDIAASTYVATYIFLENDWRIRPAEESHTLKVSNGTLLTSNGDDPFIPTVGYFNVQIKYSQPVQAQAVITETGVSGLTEAESTNLGVITTVNTKTDGLSADIANVDSDVAKTVTIGRLLAFG